MLNIFARILALLLLTVCAASGQTLWLASQRTGNEARFLFSGQIQRYDLVNKTWLPAITLPRSGATAMAADAAGVVVAYDTSIYRYATDFTGETLLGTATSKVTSLFLDQNLLIAHQRPIGKSWITVFNRTSGSKLSSIESNILSGISHAPLSNRLFGNGSVFTSIASYTTAGICGPTFAGSYEVVGGTGSRTWVFPDENQVIDASGIIYTVPGLTYAGNLAGAVTDIAFSGNAPIVLRGNSLVAYSPNLLETGRATVVAQSYSALYLTANDAFVFSYGLTDPTVNITPLSSILPLEPGATIPPEGLAYTVDAAFPDKDDNLLLLSKSQRSLFRWSPLARSYTGSIPLVGTPSFAAYSKENHCAYFAYPDQVVRKMDLSAQNPKEVPFFNMPAPITGLTSCGKFILVTDNSEYVSHHIISPAGTLLHRVGRNVTAKKWGWDPVMRRIYCLSNEFSPSFSYESISAAGIITSQQILGYSSQLINPDISPICINSEGTKIALSNGVIYNIGPSLTGAYISTAFTTGTWAGSKLITLRELNANSQLQVWEGALYLPTSVREFKGTPLGVFNTPSGMVVVASVRGTPQFTLLDALFDPLFVSPVLQVPPSALDFTNRSDASISLQWKDNSDEEDGFRMEYRTVGGTWVLGGSVGSGVTTGLITGLAAGTTYEFRVSATNHELVSAATPVLTGKTLFSPEQPAGEPYKLTITRAFNNQIKLEWRDNANNESEFKIYRSTDPSSLGTEITAPANSTSYTDSVLFANTTYYYRIQAVNGEDAGDLSAQTSVRMGVGMAPFSPQSLFVSPTGPNSILLTWADNYLSEDQFIIERREAPVNWGLSYPYLEDEVEFLEVARVGYNQTSFTDNTVSPESTYIYRLVASNDAGSSRVTSSVVTTPKLSGDFTGLSVRSGGIYYFSFTKPDRIQRYDLAARNWLPPVALQAPATALCVDEAGIFVAEGRALIRFNVDGGSRTTMRNTESPVTSILSVGEVLIYSTYYASNSLNKFTNSLVSQSLKTNADFNNSDCSVLQSKRRVFFIRNSSPKILHSIDVGTDGKLSNEKVCASPNRVYSGRRTFLFPDTAHLVIDSGDVYNTDSMTIFKSLGTSITDLDFHGADTPIVLRDNKLQAYDNNTLLPSGTFTLSASGLRLSVSGEDALVFSLDGKSPQGLSVQVVPLSDLTAPRPAPSVNPRGLSFTPEAVFVDRDGELIFFSKTHKNLFRWSPELKDYLPSLPLIGAPRFATYSKINHCVYLADDDQTLRQMNLNSETPVEFPLITFFTQPLGIATAGEFIFGVDYAKSAITHYVFSPTGALLQARATPGNSPQFYGWDAVKRIMYHLGTTDGSQNLFYDTIDPAGKITGVGQVVTTDYSTFTTPIRISADGSRVVSSNGHVIETSGMTLIATLPNTFTDALWRNNELLTIRASGNNTQLQRWDASTFAPGTAVPLFNGSPLALLSLKDGGIALITLENGVPSIRLLNEDLSVSFTYLPNSSAPPIAVEDTPFTWSPTLAWQTLGSGPLSTTATELPAWLSFANGVFSGNPLEADSGDQNHRSKSHRILLHAQNTLGLEETKELYITVAWRNDAPQLSSVPSSVTASSNAADSYLNLAPFLTDSDEQDTHTWSVKSISNSAIFTKVEFLETGVLHIDYAPQISGSAEVVVSVTDAAGASAQAKILVTLPQLPAPKITSISPVIRNPLSGLYEQKVTVKNVAARTIAGFELSITGLSSGMRFANGTTKTSAGGKFTYRHPIGVGKSVTVSLKYSVPQPGLIPKPVVRVKLIFPTSAAKTLTPSPLAKNQPLATTSIPNVANPPPVPFAIESIQLNTDGTLTLLFLTESGKTYQVQYSDDNSTWKSCPQLIWGDGNRAQWIDCGPPATASPPTASPHRFYRVLSHDP